MLLRPLLPEIVLVAETDPRLADVRALVPEEMRAVEQAVEGRQREYAAGRIIARRLLAELGVACPALTTNPDRTPRFPPASVGSISHCATLCVAAVAPAPAVVWLGVDVEPSEPLPGCVGEMIGSQRERRLSRLANSRVGERILFSAKEAVFKAIFPHVHQIMEFSDVDLVVEPGGAFFAKTHWGLPIAGRWCIAGGHIGTAVVLQR